MTLAMSRKSLLLALSLGANLALAAAFLARPAATATYFRGMFASPAATNASHAAAAKTGPAKAPVNAADKSAQPFAWTDADNTDFIGLAGRLRAAGFPLAVVRNVVTTLISQQFAERQRDLMRERMPKNYWQNGRTDVAKNIEINNQMRALNRERQNLVKAALGPDYDRAASNDPWLVFERERQFGGIPAAKIDQFNKINTDYAELTQKVHEESMGILLPEDRAKLALLEKEKKADIARLFTPDEQLEYDLRNSEAANMVRSRAGRFDLTEEEFRAVYAAQKSFEDANPRPDQLTPGFAQQRQAALDAAFHDALGDDRYAEMKKANDPAMNPGNQEVLTRLVTRLNLNPSTVPNVIAVQQDVQQRAVAIRGNTALTLGERTDQLSALATEAATKLTPLLGPTGFEAYKQNGGQWLNTLRNANGPRTLRGGGFIPNN
jgi:hypothetical protein